MSSIRYDTYISVHQSVNTEKNAVVAQMVHLKRSPQVPSSHISQHGSVSTPRAYFFIPRPCVSALLHIEPARAQPTQRARRGISYPYQGRPTSQESGVSTSRDFFLSDIRFLCQAFKRANVPDSDFLGDRGPKSSIMYHLYV